MSVGSSRSATVNIYFSGLCSFEHVLLSVEIFYRILLWELSNLCRISEVFHQCIRRWLLHPVAVLTSIIYQVQRKLINCGAELCKIEFRTIFCFFHNKMITERIPSEDCWKLAAVYDITDKICILGLPTTFTPADGGRKDVIHHLFTMGFIYSSVNSCPRERVIEFKCEALGYLLPFKFVFRA